MKNHLSYLALDVYLQICQQALDFLYENKVHGQVMEFTFKLADELISLKEKKVKEWDLIWNFWTVEVEGDRPN